MNNNKFTSLYFVYYLDYNSLLKAAITKTFLIKNSIFYDVKRKTNKN